MSILYRTVDTTPGSLEEWPRTDFSASGNLTAVNGEVLLRCDGCSAVAVDIRGTYVGTITFEATIDGTNYFVLPAIDQDTQAVVTVAASAAVGGWLIFVGGYKQVRARMTAYTSGTATVNMRGSLGQPGSGFAYTAPSLLAVTGTAAANTGVTLTLPAAGAGLFHYITRLEITRNATAALAGTATLVITSTNLPGTPAWSVGNAMAAGGTQPDVIADFSHPLKSSAANTNTTIVAPVPGAAVLWRLNAFYYVGA